MPAAWSALHRAGPAPADWRTSTSPATRTLRWVEAETAWLDGDRARARTLAGALAGGTDLATDLAAVTLAWCALDDRPPAGAAAGAATGEADPASATVDPGGEFGGRSPGEATLAAWAAGDAGGFRDAAGAWAEAMVRERVRCLLAAGVVAGDVPGLLEAERLADAAGLAVLLGRARRALRAHGIVHRPAAAAAGLLSAREREVLGLVGRGLSTRRIAEQLGITAHTAETYVKTGMAKLGAKTRTEAAVLAGAAVPAEV
jgi:DNA-binding CsgD family transcriptional regulator